MALLDDARMRTEKVVQGLSGEALHWRGEPAQSSIGDLLYHVALIEADWLYAEVLETPYPEPIRVLLPEDVQDDQGKLTHVREQTLDAHLHRLAAVRAELVGAFRPMDLIEFRRLRSLPRYDVSPEWVLHHLAQHEAEHRSQIRMTRRQAEQWIRGSSSKG
jgi:uncharacterized damage-inducible protein DinB